MFHNLGLYDMGYKYNATTYNCVALNTKMLYNYKVKKKFYQFLYY